MATEKTYVTVNYDGTMYTYSKEPREGYEAYTSSKGTTSYRKFFNRGVEGALRYLSLRKNANKNDALELNVTLGDYVLVFPVFDASGDVDVYTESFIRILPKLQKDMVYNINNWRMNKGDTVNGQVVQYTRKGVTVKCAGTKIEPVLQYITDNNPNGDIPRLVWKEIAGKNKPTGSSKEAKLMYLYEKLESEVERLKYVENGTPAPQPQTATPEQAFETVPASEVKDIKHNDLPF